MKQTPSSDYINLICSLYGDVYDDREEDSRPGGESWEPGVKAMHKSLNVHSLKPLWKCRKVRKISGWRLEGFGKCA